MSPRYLMIICLSLFLGLPVCSWGHARLVKSLPARDAVLSQAPTRVQVWFNEPLEARFSQLAVWDAAGQQVDNRDLRADPGNARTLTLSLPVLPRGRYTVKFRVLSVDSHIIDNQFYFTIQTSP